MCCWCGGAAAVLEARAQDAPPSGQPEAAICPKSGSNDLDQTFLDRARRWWSRATIRHPIGWPAEREISEGDIR